jgi:hypothetical protein
MRTMIFAAGLTVVVASPFYAGAQTTGSLSPTPGKLLPAPVGHRQPTVQSVQKAQAEKTTEPKSRAPSADLDKNLTICRGC